METSRRQQLGVGPLKPFVDLQSRLKNPFMLFLSIVEISIILPQTPDERIKALSNFCAQLTCSELKERSDQVFSRLFPIFFFCSLWVLYVGHTLLHFGCGQVNIGATKVLSIDEAIHSTDPRFESAGCYVNVPDVRDLPRLPRIPIDFGCSAQHRPRGFWSLARGNFVLVARHRPPKFK